MVPVPTRSKLVLLRHGQSEWNAKNLFTGWVNAPLTVVGEQEASEAGRLLAAGGLLPDVVHTSMQLRSIRTAELALAACDRELDTCTAVLAAELQPLRRSARQAEIRGAGRCRGAAVHGLAQVLRLASPAA